MVNIPFCNQRATMAVIRWQPEPAILEQTELVHSHMHYFLLAGPPPPPISMAHNWVQLRGQPDIKGVVLYAWLKKYFPGGGPNGPSDCNLSHK